VGGGGVCCLPFPFGSQSPRKGAVGAATLTDPAAHLHCHRQLQHSLPPPRACLACLPAVGWVLQEPKLETSDMERTPQSAISPLLGLNSKTQQLVLVDRCNAMPVCCVLLSSSSSAPSSSAVYHYSLICMPVHLL
jgi:hypothetical protein